MDYGENVSEAGPTSAKEDLADRYQNMLDSQLSAIDNIDTKAWRVARLVGVILGVFFTGVSVFPDQVSVNLTGLYFPVIISVGLGVTALVLSLVFASLCILSTTAGFGLTVGLADALNQGEIDEQTYPSLVTKSYSKNIENNISVMKAKGRRLRYSLSGLVVGVLFISTGGFFIFVTLSVEIQMFVLILVALVQVVLLDYILKMKYSVLKGEEENGRNEESTS